MPTNAIKANTEGVKLDTACGYRTGPYLILTPAWRYEAAKRVAEHGVTASLCYFAKKCPKLPLKETSVWRFKNLYIAECKQKETSNNFKGVQELLQKKDFSYQMD